MVLKRIPDKCICKWTGTRRGWMLKELHPCCPGEHEKESEKEMYQEFFTAFIEHEYGMTPEELEVAEGKNFVAKLESAWQAGLETGTERYE